MKIYVAARFHEKERVRKIYEQLKEYGHEVILDWTICKTQQPFEQHLKDARICAEHSIEGVKKCDVFI